MQDFLIIRAHFLDVEDNELAQNEECGQICLCLLIMYKLKRRG